MLTCGCGRWMHTEGIEERTCEDGSQQWFIRSECRGCGLKIGVDVPAGQMNGLVDRMMWTDDALHRLERMPPYLAPLFQDEIEQDMRARGERVVTYDSCSVREPVNGLNGNRTRNVDWTMCLPRCGPWRKSSLSVRRQTAGLVGLRLR